MNNETTNTLRLDEATMPTAEIQRFVDDLVSTYERRTLKAKVIQLDHGEHMHAHVLNLDAVGTEPTEEDVMSARIFPKQECEQAREDLMKELDRAVENYAMMIAKYSKRLYAFCVHVYLLARVVTHKILETARVYAPLVRMALEKRTGALYEQSTLATEQARANGEIPTQELNTVMAVHALDTVRSPWDTLTYSYPAGYEAVLDTPTQSARTYHESIPTHRMEIPREDSVVAEQDSVTWTNVGHCLYLQFRYGPKHLR